MYGAEYRLQCVGNDGGNVGILQSFVPGGSHKFSHRNIKKPYARLSGPIEPIRG